MAFLGKEKREKSRKNRKEKKTKQKILLRGDCGRLFGPGGVDEYSWHMLLSFGLRAFLRALLDVLLFGWIRVTRPEMYRRQTFPPSHTTLPLKGFNSIGSSYVDGPAFPRGCLSGQGSGSDDAWFERHEMGSRPVTAKKPGQQTPCVELGLPLQNEVHPT